MAILAIIVVINAPKLPKYETSITSSRLTRLQFWTVAEGVIRDHFWTGIGIKTWEDTYPQLVQKYYIDVYHKPPLNYGSVQPQNVFLDSFVKAGLPGFIAITAVLLWPIFEGIALARTYKERNPDWWVGLSLAAYGVALLVFGLIDDPLWSDDTMPILFILYFLLAFCIIRAMKKHPAKEA
jgi:O-antigen ligase